MTPRTQPIGTAAPGTPQSRRDAWLRQQLEAGRGADPDAACRLVVRLASGDADKLSGCHLSVHDDLDAMIARADEARNDGLFRLRRCNSEVDDWS